MGKADFRKGWILGEGAQGRETNVQGREKKLIFFFFKVLLKKPNNWM